MQQRRASTTTAGRTGLGTLHEASGGLLLGALVAAEAALVWLAAALALVTPAADADGLPALPVFVVIYAAVLLPRLLEGYDVWDPAYGVLMGAGVIGTALLLIKTAAFPEIAWTDPEWLRETADALIMRPTTAQLPIWGLLVVVVYAWWRGRRRGEPTLDGAYLQFRIGVPIALLGVVAHGVTGSPLSQRSVVGAVLIYFSASLLAIGVARLGGLSRPDAGRATASARGRWLGSLLVPVLVVLAVGVLVAGIASRDLLDTVLWALAPLVWGLSVLLRVLVLVVALVAFILVSPILWLLSGKQLEIQQRNEPAEDQSFRDQLQREAERVMAIPDALRYLLAFLILSAILTALTRFVLRRRKRPPALPVEDRESVFSPRDLLGALASRLRSLLGVRPHLGEDPLADLRGDRRWVHTVAIRERYTDLLRRGVDLGRPRLPGATPTEHAGRLQSVAGASAATGDLQALTERYNSARYAAEPASREEAEAANDAWRRIERVMRDG